MANFQINPLVMNMSQTTPPVLSLQQQIIALEMLIEHLKQASTSEEKIDILDEQPAVQEFLSHPSPIKTYLAGLNADCSLALKAVMAIGQGPVVFQGMEEMPDAFEKLRLVLDTLLEMEQFYDTIGGIVGYHLAVLKQIVEKKETSGAMTDGISYLQPEGINLTSNDAKVSQAVRWGIESQALMAEIYPVGGAGDRLMLIDEETQEPLPAAQLQYGGRSLLEGLIRDLQAREYLHYKLCGQQVITPIALMTSFEKNNYYHIRQICLDNDWFGRPEKSFIFFTQPLVPVITKEGFWSLSAPLKLNLKPGGHGILWKLMHENAIFDVLAEMGRRKALVRQINNPVAGTDHGLLALAGIGCKRDKAFGFASCERLLKAPEGVDVVVVKQVAEGFEYALTNIEYTDFAQRGIEDISKAPSSPYSAFPSNTNILFADLQTVEKAAEECPIPGMLINMKTKFPSLDAQGHVRQVEAGRLESTMQNIADFIVDKRAEKLERLDDLRGFITFNERRKTISVTKTSYVAGQSIQGTPEGCFYEMLQNHEELLKGCGLKLPSLGSEEEYLKQGPGFIVWYHPALGPLYEVIRQKIRGGALSAGSELQLEIAELDMENVRLEGSLLVEAEDILNGRCTLHGVTVRNQGVDLQGKNCYWKNEIHRHEELRIVLKGNAEFVAEGVVFEGDEQIEVPDGYRVTAFQKGNEVRFRKEEIGAPTWSWTYRFDDNDRVILSRSERE